MTAIDPLEELAGALGVEFALLRSVLPAPARHVEIDDGAVSVDWVACGEPVLVLVGVWEGEVIVAEPKVAWLGHEPVLQVRTRIGTVRRRSSSPLDVDELTALIIRTRRSRLGSFRRCGDCSERKPREWMLSATLCQSCAERNHGVVF